MKTGRKQLPYLIISYRCLCEWPKKTCHYKISWFLTKFFGKHVCLLKKGICPNLQVENETHFANVYEIPLDVFNVCKCS